MNVLLGLRWGRIILGWRLRSEEMRPLGTFGLIFHPDVSFRIVATLEASDLSDGIGYRIL